MNYNSALFQPLNPKGISRNWQKKSQENSRCGTGGADATFCVFTDQICNKFAILWISRRIRSEFAVRTNSQGIRWTHMQFVPYLHPYEPLTYSRWASYIAKYKRLKVWVKDFEDQTKIEHLLVQLPPFYARKLAEAKAGDGRVCPVLKVTCHDAVSIGQQIVQPMSRHSLGKPLKMMANPNCVLIHCGGLDQAAYAKEFHRVAHAVAGHAPIKVQQLVGR